MRELVEIAKSKGISTVEVCGACILHNTQCATLSTGIWNIHMVFKASVYTKKILASYKWDIPRYNPSNLFARHVTEYPQLKLGDIRDYNPSSLFARARLV